MNERVIIFFCLGVFFVELQTIAQQNLQVELTASLNQFTLKEDGHGFLSIRSHDLGSRYPEGSDAPALPLIRVSVLVPPGAELENYSFSVDRILVRENIKLAMAPYPVPVSRRYQHKPGNRLYSGNFPESTITFDAAMIQRGYTWFSFDFSPFSYNGVSGELNLARKVVLNLEYAVSPGGTLALRGDSVLSGYIRKRVVNPKDFDRFYPEGMEYGLKLKSYNDRVDYLIVTSEELKPAFKPLLDWKTRKGLKVCLVTMEEISENYDQPTLQLKLKQCLFDYYIDHGLTWVMLGGDSEIVPVQNCYGVAKIDLEDLYEDWSIPTDLFYACFDKRFDWNGYVDDKIGQIIWDNHDLVPEVYLSRIPVKTRQHVKAYVDKTIRYETDPPLTDFFGKMLLSGLRILKVWDGKSDSHHRSENFYRQSVNRLWEGKKVRFYDTGTDFLEGSDYEVTADNLRGLLNAGFGFFHFSGHGDMDCLLMEKGDLFYTDDAIGLVNPAPGLVLANSCYVNAFDSIDPCLSEAFIRNPMGGAVAFFGSSRLGFENVGVTSELGPSFKFNASFARLMYGDTNRIEWKNFASIAALAKSEYVSIGSRGESFNYLQYAINPLGDPELPLYTSDPKIFDDVRIYRMGNELSVNTGGIDYGRICLTSLCLEEGYHQVIESRSYHTFQEIPGSFQVTITAPGYRPYVYRFASPTSINRISGLDVKVYPVPAREYLNIELPETSAEVQLCDLNGQILLAMKVNSGRHKMDISKIPAGIYILKIQSPSGKSTTMIAKL